MLLFHHAFPEQDTLIPTAVSQLLVSHVAESVSVPALSGNQLFVAPSYSHDEFGSVHCRYSGRLQWTPFCGCSI